MADRKTKNPYDTFFWIDWENDENLKQCSDAAQGIWMRLLCIMARSPERGVLLLAKWPAGRREIIKPLATFLGREEGYLDAIIDELLNSETASLDDQGRIINRRMVRKYAISQARSEAGKRGAETTNAGRQKSGKGVGKRSGNDGGNQPGNGDGNPVGKTTSPESDLSSGATTENPAADAEASRQNSGNDTSKTDSKDDGKPPAKGSPSSSFMLQASKEEVTITGVETTVGHAADAGGRDSSDHPAAGSKPATPKATNRGTRIPDDWSPTSEMEQFARNRGLDPADVALEFKTYWGSRAGREALKVNWDLAFKNNIIKLSGGLRSSRPQAVAIRRAERQSDLEQFASGAMSAASGEPRKGILNR